jgi:hypothetical protein
VGVLFFLTWLLLYAILTIDEIQAGPMRIERDAAKVNLREEYADTA